MLVGIEGYPRKVTVKTLKGNLKLTGEERAAADNSVKKARSIKPFIKMVNYSHIMPTRYNLDVSDELTKVVPEDFKDEKDKAKYKEAKGAVKSKLEERFNKLNATKDSKAGTSAIYFFRCALLTTEQAAQPLGGTPITDPIPPHPPPSPPPPLMRAES